MLVGRRKEGDGVWDEEEREGEVDGRYKIRGRGGGRMYQSCPHYYVD